MSFSGSSALTEEATRAYQRRVEQAADRLQEHVGSVPSLGVVLRPEIESPEAFCPKSEWDGEALPGGLGENKPSVLKVGTLSDTPVVLVPDAPALHEGYVPREVVFLTRVLAVAGIEALLFGTTAASVVPAIDSTALVVAADHINFQGVNPLVGSNIDAWGPRFPDMTVPYAKSLRQAARATALREGLQVQEGVYFATLGPDRGSPAERRMARTLGADVLGTDTVQNVIAAHHMGVEVLSVSAVTDETPRVGGEERRSDSQGGPPYDAQARLGTLLTGIASSVKSKEKSEE